MHRLAANSLSVFLVSLLSASVVVAEVSDHGGYSDRFKGGGDKIPPRCQIDIPRAATAAFQIRWHCTDDNSLEEEIRTELFMYKKGEEFSRTVVDFLGFPAAAWIDEKLLGVERFEDGLPVSFKLMARDRAGIAMLTPYFTIRTQDVSVSKCNLNVETEATESDGETTGTPALTVTVSNAAVTSSQFGDDGVRFSSTTATTADPCEIEEVCSDDKEVSFQGSISIDAEGVATGTVSVTPGEIAVEVSGTGTIADGVLGSLSVSNSVSADDDEETDGETTGGELQATTAPTVTLTCSN